MSPSAACVCGSAIKLHPAYQSQPCSAVPSPWGPSHAFLSRDGGSQGGKAESRALCQPWATEESEPQPPGSSCPWLWERGSLLRHWGPWLETLSALTLHSTLVYRKMLQSLFFFFHPIRPLLTLWKRRETDAYDEDHCPGKKTCSLSSKTNRKISVFLI